ncbi:MAG: hypothetical protein QME05_01270 [Candidatus Margulisbacteria bacterium]|nr:hypothetical protein [Candidatus Margulisiibacteriota bacterium]
MPTSVWHYFFREKTIIPHLLMFKIPPSPSLPALLRRVNRQAGGRGIFRVSG